MKATDLDKLGFDTEGLVPDADHVPDPITDDDGIRVDIVQRAFLQLEQLNGMGGVNVLGGPRQRLDDIHLAMEDGVELLEAVDRLGDDDQRQHARDLIAAGKVTGP